MPAAGEDHQAAPAHVRHEGLVVEDQRVGMPLRVSEGLVDGEALLELRAAVDLAGDQHRAVEEERGLLLLDDLEAGSLERASARGGQLDGLAAGQGDPAPAPELGVDQHGQVRARSSATMPSIPVVWSQ